MGNSNSLVGFPPKEDIEPSSFSSQSPIIKDFPDWSTLSPEPVSESNPPSNLVTNKNTSLYKNEPFNHQELHTLELKTREVVKRKRRYSLRRQMAKPKVSHENKPSSISTFFGSSHSIHSRSTKSGRDTDASVSSRSTQINGRPLYNQTTKHTKLTKQKSNCLPFLSSLSNNNKTKNSNLNTNIKMSHNRNVNYRNVTTLSTKKKVPLYLRIIRSLLLCGSSNHVNHVFEDDITTTENGLTNRSHQISTNSETGVPVYFSSGDHLDEYTNNSSISDSIKRPVKDTFKIIILGSRGVGKSSLVSAFENLSFNEAYNPTYGIQFSTIEFQGDTNPIKLQFYDASGRIDDDERIAVFYEDIDAVIFMFSASDPESFHNISKVWFNEFCKYTSISDRDGAIKILIGNKVDSRQNSLDLDQNMVLDTDDLNENDKTDRSTVTKPTIRRVPSIKNLSHVTFKEGSQLAEELSCQYFECSTKSRQNLSIIFSSLASRLQSASKNLIDEDEDEETQFDNYPMARI